MGQTDKLVVTRPMTYCFLLVAVIFKMTVKQKYGCSSSQSETACRQTIRNSPLCWLTWHGELTAAAFLVNAGWQLRDEYWLSLPGKTDEIERFLVTVRMLASSPDALRSFCRAAIRNHLRTVSDDRDILPLITQLLLPLQIQRYLMLDSEYDLL